MKTRIGSVTKKRRKKYLKLAKGYYGAKHKLFKTSKEQVWKSFQYAFIGRKQLKISSRRNWIVRINANLKNDNISYSSFIYQLNNLNIKLNRKSLSELAIQDYNGWKELINIVKKNLKKELSK